MSFASYKDSQLHCGPAFSLSFLDQLDSMARNTLSYISSKDSGYIYIARPNEVPEERNRWGDDEDRCPTSRGNSNRRCRAFRAHGPCFARLHVCLCKNGRDLELVTGEIGASGVFRLCCPLKHNKEMDIERSWRTFFQEEVKEWIFCGSLLFEETIEMVKYMNMVQYMNWLKVKK